MSVTARHVRDWEEILKRLFIGRLVECPTEVADAMAPYCPPTPLLNDAPIRDYKVLFAVGHRC